MVLQRSLFSPPAPEAIILVLALVLVVQVAVVAAAAAAVAAGNISLTMPGCPQSCGNISIPYPFGIGEDESCYRGKNFLITCDTITSTSGEQRQRALLRESNDLEIKNISLEDGELEVVQEIAHKCYDRSGLGKDCDLPMFTLSDNFLVSTKNMFVTIGCDTVGYYGAEYTNMIGAEGCMSICFTHDQVRNGTCSGAGCCQKPIAKGVRAYKPTFGSRYNHIHVLNFSPCAYSFLLQDDKYEFSSGDLIGFRGRKIEMPFLVDWAAGSDTCDEAMKNSTSYACKANYSTCFPVENGPGYRCRCSDGYSGSPYFPNGCQDIDECADTRLNRCVKTRHCVNTMGSYTCLCPKGYRGDGRVDGKGCVRDETFLIKVAKSCIVSFVVILIIIIFFLLYLGLEKMKRIKRKQNFFQQNGGVLLKQQLSRLESWNEAHRVFTATELKRATGNYDESRIVGSGGFGTVYKGILTDNRTVAIKKSKIMDRTQTEHFINEVVVLSQVNHRNVVKLLGCCLEMPVPLLVYEFIDNSTLYDHLHNEDKARNVTWEMRLRIATETAAALSYLHSAASIPIIHRDIKSTNILLDHNYTAKVSDFGASRLIPMDQTELATVAQGTFGYIDPENFQTNRLTEKSDVYSFGVVLAEMLTGKKALCLARAEEHRNVGVYFVSCLENGCLFEILDGRIHIEHDDTIIRVAELARRTLSLRREDRPNMKQVAVELEAIWRSLVLFQAQAQSS